VTWWCVEVGFSQRLPEDKELLSLRAVCSELDSDIPRLEAWGVVGFWRLPLVELPVLRNILHILGFPSWGRWAPVDLPELDDAGVGRVLQDQARFVSSKDLSAIGVLPARTLRRLSRRFDRYLPQGGREARKGRRRRRRRSVAALCCGGRARG